MSVTLFGVDVSKYQAPAEWSRVKAAGIAFMVARASIGTLRDTTFGGHVTNARRAGLIVGGYHYLYPDARIDVERQLDTFWNQLGGDPFGYICALDVEYHGDLGTVSITDVRKFVTLWRQRAGNHTLVIYTGSWFWVGHMGNPKGSDLGPLWHSRYVAARNASPQALYGAVSPSWWTQSFGGWSGPTFLQFTSGATIPGFSDLTVDANAFRGSLSEVSAYAFPPPESSTESDPMLKFAISSVPGGSVRSLTGKIYRVEDGVRVDVDPLRVFDVAAAVTLTAPLPGFESYVGDYESGYLIGGTPPPAGQGVPYFLLAKDSVYSPPVDASAFTQSDIDAAVAADRARARIVYS